MNQNSGEKSTTASTIVYWAIYLPILAMAAISVPFQFQKIQEEQNHLETAKQRTLTEIEAQGKEIDNLNVRLQYFKGESLKKHAEKLGLHKPSPSQFVVLDRHGVPVYVDNRSRLPFQERAVASQGGKQLIYSTPSANTDNSSQTTIH